MPVPSASAFPWANRRFLLLSGVLLGLPFAGVAQGPRERPRYVLQALDLNHDGTLSASEIAAAPASLRSLDRNGDGQITPDEMEPLRTDAGASPDQLVAQLMRFDKNGDGVLTADEVPERMRPLFQRADKNNDGRLTPDEIRAAALHSGGPNGRPAEAGKASGMMRMDPVLNTLDSDHDGVISAAEISAAGTSLLTLDANHDGSIAPDEMRVRQQTPAERVAHMLDEFDTNKDGRISRDEAPDGMRTRFAAADTNGDGYLDNAELLQMFSSMPQPNRTPEHNEGAGQGAGTEPKGQHD